MDWTLVLLLALLRYTGNICFLSCLNKMKQKISGFTMEEAVYSFGRERKLS